MLKAQINLVYDQYNNRNEFMEYEHEDIVVRPFPEVDTPHYKKRFRDEKAKYVVCHGNAVLSEFIEEETAIKYARAYVSSKLDIKVYTETVGNENTPFIRAFDTGHNTSNWIYIKEIKYDED